MSTHKACLCVDGPFRGEWFGILDDQTTLDYFADNGLKGQYKIIQYVYDNKTILIALANEPPPDAEIISLIRTAKVPPPLAPLI